MNEFEFWIPIRGLGDTSKEAWDDAMEKFAAAWIWGGEWNKPPEDIFEEEDPVPSAEILGGSLSAGFGIDLGPDPIDIDAQRAADLDEMTREGEEE